MPLFLDLERDEFAREGLPLRNRIESPRPQALNVLAGIERIRRLPIPGEIVNLEVVVRVKSERAGTKVQGQIHDRRRGASDGSDSPAGGQPLGLGLARLWRGALLALKTRGGRGLVRLRLPRFFSDF